MLRHSLCLAALAAAIGCPSREARAQEAEPPAAQLQRKTLEQCVQLALARNIEVRTASEERSVAEAERSSVRGQMGPRLNLDANYQHWNEPYVFDGIRAHELNVWNVTATIIQPLSGLFAIYDAYKVRDLGVDIAAVRLEATRRQTAYRVVESYYRLLQAESLVDVAAASVEQLNAQLRQANSFHENGTVSRDDVLRAQLAVANAEQRRIAARTRVTLARAQLALYMGLSPDSPIDAAPLPSDRALPREVPPLAQAEKLAEAERVELREVDKRIAMSDYDKRLAYAKLAPQISLVGAYIHNEGSLFNQINAGYVGAVASWNVWDWGSTWSGISEAEARARQALLARSKVADQIRLEVMQAALGVTSASEAMEVAKASVAAAEENYRLVSKRYEASVATSFDVVDAEGLLTQARGQMQTALFDFVIAHAGLDAAMGAKPEKLAQE